MFFACTRGQWFKINNGGLTHFTTEPDAMPPGRRDGLLWCHEDDLYLYGGSDGSKTPLNDFWKFETESNRWLWMPDPPLNLGNSISHATWTALGRLWLLDGGFIWSFHPLTRQWKQEAAVPEFNSGTVAWMHLRADTAYIYGSSNSSNAVEMYSFNVETKVLDLVDDIGNAKPKLDGLVAFGEDEGIVYVFQDRLYTFDLATSQWHSNTTFTDMRQDAALWVGPDQARLLLFGGKIGADVLADPREYVMETKEWRPYSKGGGPSPRWGMMTCTDRRGSTFLFGGTEQDIDKVNNDLWKFGPLDKQNFLDVLNFQLNALSLSSYLAALFGIFCFTILISFCFYFCVKKCRERCDDKRILFQMRPSKDLDNAFEVAEDGEIVSIF